MSPTSCHCSTPHQYIVVRLSRLLSGRDYSMPTLQRQGETGPKNIASHSSQLLTTRGVTIGVAVGEGVLSPCGIGTNRISFDFTHLPSR